MRRLLRMQEIEESFRSDYEKIRARVRESGIKKLAIKMLMPEFDSTNESIITHIFVVANLQHSRL